MKWIPVLLILIGGIYILNNRQGFVNQIPFLTGAGIIFFIYPTFAYEYNITNLFSFIPLLFVWIRENPGLMNKAVLYLFLFFLLLASHSNFLKPIATEAGLAAVYLTIALIFILAQTIQFRGRRYAPD